MKTKALLLVLALQSAVLLGLVVTQEVRLTSDQVIRLETMPVDPRDLLRGDYVILNYKMSSLADSLFTPLLNKDTEVAGKNVFVVLEKSGEFYEPVVASFMPPRAAAGQVVVQGEAKQSWGEHVRVDYGLERFYVKEGTGNPRGKLTVDVAVTSSGKPIIKQVYLDGKPYAEAMKSQKP